jgi:hypothetical protein
MLIVQVIMALVQVIMALRERAESDRNVSNAIQVF